MASPAGSPLRWSGSAAATLTLLPLTMPLAAAGAIGASTGSPFGEGEVTGSRSLGPLRLGHLAGLLAVAAVALALAATLWSRPDGARAGQRSLLGSGPCWAVPLGYAVLALLASQTGEAGQAPAWAWAARAATDREAAVIATALLLAGLALVARSGARDRLGETTETA